MDDNNAVEISESRSNKRKRAIIDQKLIAATIQSSHISKEIDDIKTTLIVVPSTLASQWWRELQNRVKQEDMVPPRKFLVINLAEGRAAGSKHDIDISKLQWVKKYETNEYGLEDPDCGIGITEVDIQIRKSKNLDLRVIVRDDRWLSNSMEYIGDVMRGYGNVIYM